MYYICVTHAHQPDTGMSLHHGGKGDTKAKSGKREQRVHRSLGHDHKVMYRVHHAYKFSRSEGHCHCAVLYIQRLYTKQEVRKVECRYEAGTGLTGRCGRFRRHL